MQSTIQETNKPVTTQTHLERLLQPAAAPAPCWACSRHVGPPCAAATRDLLGNSCCSWPSLPQLGASFGMDFASPGPAGLAQHVLRRNKLRGMNESWNWIEQNCLAHMKWSWTALKWMDRTKWDDLDWTALNWADLKWIDVQWVELQGLELSWILLYWIDFNALNWAQLDWAKLLWNQLNRWTLTELNCLELN